MYSVKSGGASSSKVPFDDLGAGENSVQITEYHNLK